MNKYILRIDDVGRLPTDADPHMGTDQQLTHFFDWQQRAGLHAVPAVYGLTPTWVDEQAIQQFKVAIPSSQRALHGWDHVKGSALDLETMNKGLRLLGSTAYIPPFNDYQPADLLMFKQAGGRHFFGGFYLEHYTLGGPGRASISGVIHWPACRELYGSAAEIIERLPNVPEQPDPVVVTLHVPWEHGPENTRRLVEKLRPNLIDIGTL